MPSEIERGGAATDRDWSCIYAPTYDRDWHNDVMCRRGLEVKRPYLLAGDSFVTESEIIAAAASYERQLNGG